MWTALTYTKTRVTRPPHNCVVQNSLYHQQRVFLPAWLRHNTHMPTTTNLSTATTSHEHCIKITALPKLRRHLGTLGMKAAAVSSARMVTFLRNYTTSHFRITDMPETWLYTNRKSHKWSLCGFCYGIPYKGQNRSSFLIYLPRWDLYSFGTSRRVQW